jgi:hypothetical protein
MHSIYQDLKPITKDTDWYALPLPHTENFIIPYINLQIPETMRAYETDWEGTEPRKSLLEFAGSYYTHEDNMGASSHTQLQPVPSNGRTGNK